MRPIFAGFSCNNSCGFCSQGVLRTLRQDPSDAVVRSAIEQALGQDKDLAFVGGEPSLRQELPAWIALAKKLGAAWTLLQTNGRRLFYEDYCAALKEAGLDACEVALQGSTAPMHDYHTGVAGGWVQTVGGLRQARLRGLKISVGVVVTRSNFRHLSEIAEVSHSLDAAALRLAFAQPFGRALAARDRIVPTADIAMPFIDAALRRARELGLEAFHEQDAPARLRRLFAGLGETEPVSQTAPEARPDLAKSKPKPGSREVHTTRKRTGEELKTLFPGLFKGTPGA